MPHIASIGTYLPCWGTEHRRTAGASSGLFALAALAESDSIGPLVAVEQASLSGITVASGETQVIRCERGARPVSEGAVTRGADLQISPAAYERAFEAKVRWGAGKYADSDGMDLPPRNRVVHSCALSADHELTPLPRTGTVYTEVTVEIPVPGLRSPDSPVIVELVRSGVPDYGYAFQSEAA